MHVLSCCQRSACRVLFSLLIALAGCEGSDARDVAGVPLDGPAVTGTAADTLTARPANPVSLAALAGEWTLRAIPESGDPRPTNFEVTATDVPRGWTIKFPRRPPVPLLILAVEGDSIVTEAGPYASARRPGVQVRTYGVIRHVGDRLVGRIVAHYQTGGPDSVQTFRVEGTRKR